MATKSSRKRKYDEMGDLDFTKYERTKQKKDSVKNIVKCDFEKYKPKSENQKRLVEYIKEKDLIMVIGEAGSGKTLLTLNESLKLLTSMDNNYKQIYLLKSVKGLEDEEDIGFLPGEADDKLRLPFYSYTGNLIKILGDETKIEHLRQYNHLVYQPLYYMRGTSISNGIVILDEAQNVSLDILKTIMTRIEDTSKLIILGDEKQIDMKFKTNSGLRKVFDKFKTKRKSEIGCVRLDSKDIFRNKLIKTINKVFKEIEDEDNV